MAESRDRRDFLKKAALGSIALASLPTVGAGLSVRASADDTDDGADRVRWDIISQSGPPGSDPTPELNPGGVAFAKAHFPDSLRIKLTGAGTFVARSGGGVAGRGTGGGTWETLAGSDSTGSGTFKVTRIASWHFASFQAIKPPAPAFIDNIGDENERANGNAVLLIKYSDGSRGILGVACHGPGAPDGIQEGIVASKDFRTYWTMELPKVPFTDENRTIFHVRQLGEDGDD